MTRIASSRFPGPSHAISPLLVPRFSLPHSPTALGGTRYFIGNEALADTKIEAAKFCFEDSSGLHGRACTELNSRHYSYTGDIPFLNSTKDQSLHKIIAALSGQIKFGATPDGANGEFIDLNDDGSNIPNRENPNYCADSPEADAVPFPCILKHLAKGNTPFDSDGNVRQWTGSQANWYIYGLPVMQQQARPCLAQLACWYCRMLGSLYSISLALNKKRSMLDVPERGSRRARCMYSARTWCCAIMTTFFFTFLAVGTSGAMDMS